MFLDRRAVVVRETFDPKNRKHLKSLETFLRTGSWGDVSFYVEAPFTDVPATVLTKFAMSKLNVEAETASERVARMALKNLVLVPEMA